MPATSNRVTCPICHQAIRQSAHREVMLPHTDSIGKHCPMSGKEIGANMSDPQDTINS